jgi:hypothetical protein
MKADFRRNYLCKSSDRTAPTPYIQKYSLSLIRGQSGHLFTFVMLLSLTYSGSRIMYRPIASTDLSLTIAGFSMLPSLRATTNVSRSGHDNSGSMYRSVNTTNSMHSANAWSNICEHTYVYTLGSRGRQTVNK